MDTASTHLSDDKFITQGDRLNHLLDQIGFYSGHGRISHLQDFLQEYEPNEFSEVNYTTVRAWFRDTAPPMRKVSLIIDSLSNHYTFKHDLSLIKTWWKVGGRYPFEESYRDQTLSEERLSFLVLSLMEKQLGDKFHSYPNQKLAEIKKSVMAFAQDYADPKKQQCPSNVLEVLIREMAE